MTEAEYEEHMISHYPFRSWCPHCVRGKANAGAHRMDKGLVQDHPTVNMDYCFPIKRKSDESVEDYTAKRGSPIVAMYDDKLGLMAASYVSLLSLGTSWRSWGISKSLSRATKNVLFLRYVKKLRGTRGSRSLMRSLRPTIHRVMARPKTLSSCLKNSSGL